jgi:PAS domain S-box-containing protein
MSGLPSPQRVVAWRRRPLWLGAGSLVLLISLILVAPIPDGLRRFVSEFGLLVGGATVVVACLHQARRSKRSRRRAWILVGAAAALYTARTVWRVSSPMETEAPFSPAELCLVLALLLGVTAVFTFPSTPRRLAQVAGVVLDGVVIGSAMLFFASVIWLPRFVGPGEFLASEVLLLVVLVVHITIAMGALLLCLRLPARDRAFLGLVAIGFALLAIADFGAAVVAFSVPINFGAWLGIGRIAGYLTIAFAVLAAPTVTSPPVEPRREGSGVLSTAFMLTLFFLSGATSLWAVQNGGLSPVSYGLWFLVLFGVIARQVLLVVDNDRMRHRLEMQVLAGTRDLSSLTHRTDLLLNSVADGIYGVDEKGLITFVNPVAAGTLGYAPDKLIGVKAHDEFHAPQPSGAPYPEHVCYISDAISRGMVTNPEEDRYVRPDGRLVPVEVTASPISADGRPLGAVVVFRDITQRQEIDRLKNEFISVVSHELRTPLTSIRGSVGLVASGSLGRLTPTAQRMVTIALEASVRLDRLINDILDVERIHSGVLPMSVGQHSARALIEAAVAPVQVLAREAHVSIAIASVEGEVAADGDRVEQTLINLLDNAVKFSPPCAVVTVEAKCKGSVVEFVVTDTGRGIPPEKLDSIFRRFEQVDSSDARDHGGTGLGLAISRSIIERLGGRIWAENNPAGGATLRFTLPRIAAASPLDQSVEPIEVSTR